MRFYKISERHTDDGSYWEFIPIECEKDVQGSLSVLSGSVIHLNLEGKRMELFTEEKELRLTDTQFDELEIVGDEEIKGTMDAMVDLVKFRSGIID